MSALLGIISFIGLPLIVFGVILLFIGAPAVGAGLFALGLVLTIAYFRYMGAQGADWALFSGREGGPAGSAFWSARMG